MNWKIRTLIIIIIALLIVITYLTFQLVEFYKEANKESQLLVPIDEHQSLDEGELLKDIEKGKSIMWLEPHPDDEVYSPGLFAVARDKGNQVWVVTLVEIASIPTIAQIPRQEAINWFEEKYLKPGGGEYINLGMKRGSLYPPPCSQIHGYCWTYEELKAAYKKQIEEKRPDMLVTFSPFGYMGGYEHAEISKIAIEVWNELDWETKPKIYWFINTNQGPRVDAYNENELYPPTDVLELDVHSDVLNMTYWEAKIEIWQKYSISVPPLKNFLTPEFIESGNDKKEYFFEVSEEKIEEIIEGNFDEWIKINQRSNP